MAVSWIIVGIVVVALFILIFKSQNGLFILTLLKQNLFYIVIIGLLLFVTFSLYHIHTTYNIELTSYEGLIGTGKIYFSWLKNVFVNLGKVTGYATQQDWVLNNVTAKG